MSYAESALEAMYGNEGLTDELTDEEAKPLLKWGENEIMRLDALNLDEETFDAKFKQVRQAMKRINKYIAERANIDEIEAQEMLAQFTEGVYELGYEIGQEKVDSFIASQQTLSNLDTVHAILNLMQPETPIETELSGSETEGESSNDEEEKQW